MKHAANDEAYDYQMTDLAIFDIWKSIGDLCTYQHALLSGDLIQIKKSIAALKAIIRRRKAELLQLKLHQPT